MTAGLVDKEIVVDADGTTVVFSFVQFSTTAALKTLTRLTKILGEPLAIALGGADMGDTKTSIGDWDLSGKTMGAAMKALVDRLHEDEVLSLVKLLAADNVLQNGGKIVFDDFYRGKMKLLLKVFQTALVVQYGNFISAVNERSVAPIPPGGIAAR